MDLLFYLLFSTIEGIGVFYLSLSLFRFNIKAYIIPIVLINILIALVSYALRGELSLTWAAPIIQLMLLVFFIQILVRIPIIWSFIMAFTGIILFTLIQTIILSVLTSINLVELNLVKQGNTLDTIIGQSFEIFIIFPLCYFLYKKGFGFTFDFGKFSFLWEDIFILILLIITFAGFTVISIMNNLILLTLILTLCLVFYLTYHFRKEKTE